MHLMDFQFLESCGITGVFSVFLGSLFVFVSMILTYSFRQIGLKKYLFIHGIFVATTCLSAAALYNAPGSPEAVQMCASAPLKMLLWIPAMMVFTAMIRIFFRKKAKA